MNYDFMKKNVLKCRDSFRMDKAITTSEEIISIIKKI